MAQLNELGRKAREKAIVKAGGIAKYIENVRRIVMAEKGLLSEEKIQANIRLVNDMERKLKQAFPHLDYKNGEPVTTAIVGLA